MQNIFLFLASLFFYAWGEPRFVLVMMLSIVLNWFAGVLIARLKDRGKAAKFVLVCALIANTGVLFVFKYMNFAVETAESIFNTHIDILSVALPVGISFFTFQAMSYVIDVYRGDGAAQKNILNVGLYISFFPQLIAGPIVRYNTIADQIKNRVETKEDFTKGFVWFIFGLSKKVLLANNLALIADAAFSPRGGVDSISTASAWLGAFAYTLQIYFDFCGYSDMAIGLGRMFGFHFDENFNFPYISASVSEFWRRWHISLGTWFRDYVYIPLGGSRRGKGRVLLNLFVVWTLTGIWHGANWTFLVWGLMYFMLIAAEKLTVFGNIRNHRVAGRIYTMFFVVCGWVLFRSDSLGAAANYFKSMAGLSAGGIVDEYFLYYLKTGWIYIVLGVFFATPAVRVIKERMRVKTDKRAAGILYTAWTLLLFLLSVAGTVSDSYNPFIYFNF